MNLNFEINFEKIEIYFDFDLQNDTVDVVVQELKQVYLKDLTDEQATIIISQMKKAIQNKVLQDFALSESVKFKSNCSHEKIRRSSSA